MSLESVCGKDDDENIDPFDFTMCQEDSDLTNLAWLQNSNLLTNIKRPAYHTSLQRRVLPSSPHLYENVVRKKGKPGYSFTCLIFMAIEASPTHCLPVKGIYDWIMDSFPYFANAPAGWRNSIRHNLSLNKCFKRVHIVSKQGVKSCVWHIDPESRPQLLQTFNRYLNPHSNNLPIKIRLETEDKKSSFKMDSTKNETYDIASMLLHLSQNHENYVLKKNAAPSVLKLPDDHQYSISDSINETKDIKVELDENLGAIESDISTSFTAISAPLLNKKPSGLPLLINAVDEVEHQRRIEGINALLDLANSKQNLRNKC